MVGIMGMGGIGKTTIAQTLFRKISYMFEVSSFNKGVRERDICDLQQKILKDILVLDDVSNINDPEDGADMIKTRFCNKKVLLVLDDVDDVKQLDFLAARHEWFGRGSRIIITTRDEHLLSDTDAKYKPPLLLMEQAVELFSRHAFRKNNPTYGYKELVDRAICCTGFLPLALKVLGSFFRGREAGVWESALDRLVGKSNREIFGTLKLSFDGLEESEKKIFLDIACFFKGREVNDVCRVLDSCGLYTGIGISILIEKSLITVSKEVIDMHDLLQEMGRQIVCENFPNSRLWQLEQIHDSIKKKRNMRLLHVYGKFTSIVPTTLPDELQSLCWDEYPFLSMPVAHMEKLVDLGMRSGQIQSLWIGQKIMPNLKFIHLESCNCISSFPDVSGAPNIERLILFRCESLSEVHESLGSLKKLVYLDLSNCGRLQHLPSMIEMESLETLNISSTGLERFPEFSPCMVKLSHIHSRSCHGIKELPSSIRYLINLNILNLEACSNLEKIPNSICELKHLKSLFLENCPKLLNLPKGFGSLENLQELHLEVWISSAKFTSMHAFTSLCCLRKLDLNLRQIRDEDFPNNLHGLSSSERLNLTGNRELTRSPVSISHLSRLTHLELNNCVRLHSLHGLPLGIQVLMASGCSSLENIEDLSKKYESLSRIWFRDCHKLLGDEGKCAAVDSALSVAFPGTKIPSWFKEQHNGHQITLTLFPKWQTRIAGFALCGVFEHSLPTRCRSIKFRFENAAMFVPKFEVEHISASTTSKDGNVWLGYIPFSSFQQMHRDDDFQQEGNLFITVWYGIKEFEVVRCGAQIVYKEDVESIQQIKPYASYQWKWKLILGNHTITTNLDNFNV
ncbi:hypothetical protein L1987_54338 [Smallanthus sonchifolius]|uniref:Uncharacterized protein n=1 Tax=Smallanthus sonchifolius TaxID=185202 RepID=A0ACB9E6D2_9ASTR|nr:hypothetical protein L1987_54338 [Smallanthus sonchifolius]